MAHAASRPADLVSFMFHRGWIYAAARGWSARAAARRRRAEGRLTHCSSARGGRRPIFKSGSYSLLRMLDFGDSTKERWLRESILKRLFR